MIIKRGALLLGMLAYATALYAQQPVTQKDSAGGDATDTVNHAIKVTLPIGANVTATVSGTPAVQGNATNNAAVTGTNNVKVLPCIANAAAPTLTETFQVACSEDLSGNIRVTVSNAAVLGQGAASGANPVVMAYAKSAHGGTGAMTGTSSTQVIAGVTSNYLYISSCSVSNIHASVDTLVDLQDGTAGTVLWTFTAPHAYGGESHSFGDHPLPVPTQGNGLFAVDETTGASVKVFCNGFSSTVNSN